MKQLLRQTNSRPNSCIRVRLSHLLELCLDLPFQIGRLEERLQAHHSGIANRPVRVLADPEAASAGFGLSGGALICINWLQGSQSLGSGATDTGRKVCAAAVTSKARGQRSQLMPELHKPSPHVVFIQLFHQGLHC